MATGTGTAAPVISTLDSIAAADGRGLENRTSGVELTSSVLQEDKIPGE